MIVTNPFSSSPAHYVGREVPLRLNFVVRHALYPALAIFECSRLSVERKLLFHVTKYNMSRFFHGSDSSSDSSEEEDLYTDEEEEKKDPKADESSEDSSSEEEDEDDSDSDDSSDEEGGAKGVNRFLRSDDEEESSEEEEDKVTVVKSAKDKKFEELEGTVRLIENAEKIGDWTVISAGMRTYGFYLYANTNRILLRRVRQIKSSTSASDQGQ